MVNFDIFHLLKIVIKFLKVNLRQAILIPFPIIHFQFVYNFYIKSTSFVSFFSKLKCFEYLYFHSYILFLVFSLILDDFQLIFCILLVFDLNLLFFKQNFVSNLFNFILSKFQFQLSFMYFNDYCLINLYVFFLYVHHIHYQRFIMIIFYHLYFL